ncbi:hypothetical protein M0R45_028561 [Rubus argutus]|uniref:Uncharacterized protein n=1 Tax=Rubus argutus TaxID=59490 RepID=A0AAW1W6C8_RUBAR
MGIVLALLYLSACCWGAADAANMYDYIQFVQQWPSTFCAGNPNCVPNPPRNYFTLHGLWPSNYSTPGHECMGTNFSTTEMSATENHGLRDYFLPLAWPQLKAQSTNMDFWQYEYNKHGTCSENNLSQTEYFKKAYLLWYHYNAYNLFAVSAQPIYPGAYYYSIDLKRAIQQTTQHEPLLVCKSIRVGKIYIMYLQEVIICFDQMGNNVVPCGSRLSNCGPVAYYGY